MTNECDLINVYSMACVVTECGESVRQMSVVNEFAFHGACDDQVW